MKITGFNPIIITKNQDAIVKMFEGLGFEKSHQPEGTAASGFDFTVVRMKDANGFHVDVALSAGPIPQDITAIRINVDDFSEAYGTGIQDNERKTRHGNRFFKGNIPYLAFRLLCSSRSAHQVRMPAQTRN